ncbi:polysaccharide biosynthesis protein [Clostridium botulinum]|uniref:cytidylyltransferase domain-containing protein n=1 Tax=Clostridium botulinum TaxID=1491 RepID=UPI0013C60368|nr:NTP transferase domain-containing protein [Clostridium botulinum]MBY6836414.1 polysaccharide biosynthesis protein [Clostridium botulinum]NFG64258.1 polysaccharide biosynthesis protein [Clostridium botulinum]NFN18139.1 polysaccharide biosynthesis protein [Clostridium botulinum]NFN47808.1 polysaccharide biosynthesis protein [Clostridium botulinum]NFQ23030.1 polysaccharide biosynthesis protein [Clostridium botulinum]
MLNGKKVVALIQARCTSTRLPLKHFRYIGDKMLIDWVVDRLENINEIDDIIISTTNDVTDEPLKEYAERKCIEFYGFDGDINDVVGRHYNALKDVNADYIVVISGDCPLVDKEVISAQLELLNNGYDYCRPTKPCIHEGIDSYSSKCIKFINDNSRTSYDRENFGIIIRENPELVKVGYFSLEDKYLQNKFRISVDNMADLRFMNKVVTSIKDKDKSFNLENVIDLVKENKDLLNENSHVEQKKKGEKTYKFLIKTEASQEKGLGHIKRMMALGQFLNENKNNGVLYAINNDEISKNILDEKGYIYDYSYAESEEELIKLTKEYNPDILIIDVQKLERNTSYNFENIKKQSGVKKIILIDKYVEDYFVDLMIIQGIQSDEFEDKVKGNNKVIQGLKTLFINHDFRKVKWIPKNEIVISFGGTDINNLTTKMIELLNSIDIKTNCVYKIIVGPYFKFINELKHELTQFKCQYKIIINPKNVAEEIKNCKLGITYYGVSFYEFKFLGIPTIDIVSDEIYENEFKKISSLGIGNYCGTKYNLDVKKIEKFINNIQSPSNLNVKISDFEFVYEKIVEVL